MRTPTLIVALASGLVLAKVSCGQIVPDYGFTWRVIGDPGNPGARPEDYLYLQGPVGQVNYEYRLTQTELTVGQWLEFLVAYSAVNPNVNVHDPALKGWWIEYREDVGWYAPPDVQDIATTMGWFYAARYVNWLQNDKAMTFAAFEDGVYNLAGFHQLPDGTWVGDPSREPGARYWIPSFDEWDKAMHWDPNKYGPGQGGYWLYPTSTDTPPVCGIPGTPGAQTSAGSPSCIPFVVPPSVGSYPDVQSPWGLLDGSGGVSEWLDLWGEFPGKRGSELGSSIIPADRLDWPEGDLPTWPGGGLRVASLVPACGSADFNGDGDTGTDADIEAFFACLTGTCCPTCGSPDFNGDGDTGTDADIEAFFRVLAGGTC